jgi:hypothetical protein
MRDIRSDLQERAAIIGEHVKSAQVHFETVLEQFKRDHESKIKELRAELEAVNVLLGIEQRRHEGAPPAQVPQQHIQAEKSPRPLSGILLRRAG